ncbi:glucose PTS transporter subunit IIA [Peptostreptococcaceae bacterium AGR-M142]
MSKNGIFAKLQKVGKSLMLPVSVLPAAGLMVAFSRLIENSIGAETVAANPILNALVLIMFRGGLVVFENLPIIFAIGVAIGFTAGEAVAGLASVVGYVVLTKVLSVMSEVQGLEVPINMGIFSGIIIGLVAANVYNKYYKTKLHPVLGFFQGKRLVPILMVAIACTLGIVFGFIWPPIQDGINWLGQQAIDAEIFGFRLGGAIYALGNRALIPTGLHHVFKTPFTVQFGEYIHPQTGEVFIGEVARFFAGDPTAGNITAAEYPLKIFGLPAAALAIYLTAKPENKKAVGGAMLTASLTSIITGITEPIEFAFMFVAPILYLTHVGLAFVGGLLMNMAGVRLSETFTSSLIDYFVSIATGNAGNPMLLFPVGVVIFVAYFATFYYFIKKFDLKTPGREEESEEIADISASQKAVEVLLALGDAKNIKHIDACITRLRLELNDDSIINEKRLKALGASGVMKAGGGSVQVVFGPAAEGLKDEIKTVMAAGGASSVDIKKEEVKEETKEKIKKAKRLISSPMKGKLVDLKDVPDQTFADKLLGEGIAIEPVDGLVTSPVSGEIVQLFRTNHAVGLKTDDGLEVLVHVGIDTVNMNGEGFEAFVKQGDRVEVGDKLLNVDLELVKQKAKSIITPIVVTNTFEFDSIKSIKNGDVANKEDIIEVN